MVNAQTSVKSLDALTIDNIQLSIPSMLDLMANV